ncbi:hypothetical protein ABT214_00470 [Micromonospora purpureochromogenes]
MQQWLDIIQSGGHLLSFTAAFMNLTTAILNRRSPRCGHRHDQ